MIIRKDQYSEFAKHSEAEFRLKARKNMQEFWPQKCDLLGDAALTARVNQDIEAARSWGIDDDGEILRYLNLQFAVIESHPRLDEETWAMEILSSGGMTAGQKVDALWSEAERRHG